MNKTKGNQAKTENASENERLRKWICRILVSPGAHGLILTCGHFLILLLLPCNFQLLSPVKAKALKLNFKIKDVKRSD